MPIAIAVFAVALVGCGRVGVELITFGELEPGPKPDGAILSEVPVFDLDGSYGADASDGDAGLSEIPEAGPVHVGLDGDLDGASEPNTTTDASAFPSDADSDAGAGTADATAARDAATADAGQRCSTYGPFETPVLVSGLQITGNGWGPAWSADALTLYFAENTGADERIMMARRVDRGAAFSAAVEVPNVQSSAFDGTPFITPDGLTFLFYSERSGSLGARDIWLATRSSTAAAFAAPSRLANVNTIASEQHPNLSADGLTLLLNSNRGEGLGDHDIWMSTRTSASSPFSAAINVTELNSTDEDSSPALSADGLYVIFASDRPGGVGGNDLWMATRSSPRAAFGAPVNLTVLNSSTTDSDCAISADGREIVFSSIRDGVRRLWRSIRACN